MSTIPITERGVEMLKGEFHRLKTKECLAVANTIAEARAQGDLSENADYDTAKERQSFIESRTQEIESKLSAAQIIDLASLDADSRVAFDATIDLGDPNSGELVTYQIVGDNEADLETGKVSISSPIVRALIGKFEGDAATVVTSGDERGYKVLAIKYL